jgi:hypothetical protein
MTMMEQLPRGQRYLIERTFPPNALDGVDAAAKQSVNANNAVVQVTWEKSYANAGMTKTYCIYRGPNEAAVREAARLNGLPVDNVTEIPLDYKPEPAGAVHEIAAGKQRYLVTRRGDVAFHDVNDGKFGVRLITVYLTSDNLTSHAIYEAPDFSSVERAAKASGAPFESIAEIPQTLYPR